jgi:hypothetical protein
MSCCNLIHTRIGSMEVRPFTVGDGDTEGHREWLEFNAKGEDNGGYVCSLAA